ncbi:MAG: cell division protein FtsQ [Bacteroidaceae bacterium]|nr:cell division protein FtsQ [Bacteroidaceae bacterium]
MIKRILSIILAVLAAGYLVFSLVSLTGRSSDSTCKGLDVRIHDSLDYNLLKPESVISLLQRSGLDPTGRDMSQADLDSMEHVLLKHPLVLSAECFRTSSGTVKVRIESCTPVVRVLASNGADYMVDSRGRILEHSGCVMQLPVATGHITREYAVTHLLEAVRAINRSRFWAAQVEQINVTSRGEMELVPRVGNHIISLGTGEDVDEKLDRVLSFYENGLERIGWNKYSRVSAAFAGQIVCRKRK